MGVNPAAVSLHNQVFNFCVSLLTAYTHHSHVYTSTDNSDVEVWETDEVEDLMVNTDTSVEMPPSAPTFNNSSPESFKASSLLQWLVMFLLLLQAKYSIPDSAIDVLFHFLNSQFLLDFHHLLQLLLGDFHNPNVLH